jgi:two-component system LytT family response regulator
MSIRTILVDDEPLATQGLQLRLQAHDDVEIVGTAANGREAIRAIKTTSPISSSSTSRCLGLTASRSSRD